jgi:hypothetical protein
MELRKRRVYELAAVPFSPGPSWFMLLMEFMIHSYATDSGMSGWGDFFRFSLQFICTSGNDEHRERPRGEVENQLLGNYFRLPLLSLPLFYFSGENLRIFPTPPCVII